jgi:hypothetical protein
MKAITVHYDNLAKHGVSPKEVRECLQGRGRRYLRKVGPDTYRLVAQISSGRYLELIYKELADERFVFHAMDARHRDIRLLKRRGKGR